MHNIPKYSKFSFEFRGQSTLYMTHDIHPFPARFPPQLPKWGIDTYSEPKDTIFDPFCGSGTTLVEARLAGRNAWGTDIDPLSILISTGKATPMDPNELQKGVQDLIEIVKATFKEFHRANPNAQLLHQPPSIVSVNSYSVPTVNFKNRDFWFHPKVVMELSLLSHLTSKHCPHTTKTIAQIALSSTIISKGKSSVANVADLVHTRPHRRVKPVPLSVEDMFLTRLSRIVESVVEFACSTYRENETKIDMADARNLVRFDDESVDLIFTSPPYINAIDYPRSHKFSLVWLGWSLSEYKKLHSSYIGHPFRPITRWKEIKDKEQNIREIDNLIDRLRRRSLRSASIVRSYFLDIEQSLHEMFRVLKSGKRCILVLGPSTLTGIRIATPEYIMRLAVRSGFEVEAKHFRTLDQSKRSLPFRSGKFNGGIHNETIIILKKHGG